ncbi:MAG: phenylalanine--tRNA ligase subunit beta [Thermodesulfovibrionia bacterium]
MRLSLDLLKGFVDFSLSAKEVSHILTMAGLEVEGIEDIDGDTILEVSITPNRADCLSILGIARELSANLQIPIRYPIISLQEDDIEPPIIEILDTSLCHRYASRLIQGVKVGVSPQWLIKRLESLGMRPVNNIVDITNYVLLEMGHPLHAFDLDMLEGKGIVVKKAGQVSRFRTLDGVDRELNSEILMIWDLVKPVAIAGVMGGLNSEVTTSTTDVLLESAYFDPVSIRRASRFLNLTTEASYRFERGVDIEIVVKALDRAAMLIRDIAGGRVSRLTDNYPVRFVPHEIYVGFQKINGLLGIDIDESLVEGVLKRLGLGYRREGEGLVVIPPSYRRDIQRDVDVIEEVARLYGYERLPSTIPATMPNRALRKGRDRTRLINLIKGAMVGAGFTEVVNPSFMNLSSIDELGIPHDDKRRDVVQIMNPLRREEAYLRTTLIPSLLNNARVNQNRGEKSFSFFEVSRVFFDNKGDKLPEEVMQMAGIHCKSLTPSIWQKPHEGFYDIKGAIENMFRNFKISDYSFEPSKGHGTIEPYLHPAKSCVIKVNNRVIGSMGEVHPSIASVYEIRGDISIFEITNIDRMIDAIPSSITFKQLPRYPYIERDISIVVNRDIMIGDIKSIISSIGSEFIEFIELFDIYTGKQIPSDKKSVAFTIRYRASDRTLTDEEVDTIHSEVINRLKDSINAELRG